MRMLKTTQLKTLQTQLKTLQPVRPGATARTRGRAWQDTRARILQRDAFTCASCGRVHLSHQVDHVTPLHKGGSNDDSNLQTLCVQCHQVKTSKEARHRSKPKG